MAWFDKQESIVKRIFYCAVISLALSYATMAKAPEIYLDKLDKTLDDWWNALDNVCRGFPGDSEESKLACNQRLAVDEILEKKGCRNIYPTTGPHDTSYWLCVRPRFQQDIRP
jgi:hypothetical protein